VSITRAVYLIAGLLIIISLGACSKSKKKENPKAGPPPTPRVEAYRVVATTISDKLEIPGSVVANEATEIHPEISGRLTYLNTAEGKVVSKGTLLAKIYDGDLRAQLAKLQSQLKVQQQTADRYESLLKIQGVSQQEYDMIRLEINNIRADMEVVQSNIIRTEIRAPFSGTLGLRMVSPGAYVSPATVITTLRQNNQLKIDFTVPERFTSQILSGQKVNFTAEGNPTTYEAKVIATESGVDEANRSLNVRALVQNNDGKLLPGAFAKVNISFAPDTNAIMIPSQAVIPQVRGKQVAVYSGGVVLFKDVETGMRDSSRIEITKGLEQGDTIITTGLMSLKPNAKVQLAKIN
jgi:membrane fusion protein (multidrug efflux system)